MQNVHVIYMWISLGIDSVSFPSKVALEIMVAKSSLVASEDLGVLLSFPQQSQCLQQTLCRVSEYRDGKPEKTPAIPGKLAKNPVIQTNSHRKG